MKKDKLLKVKTAAENLIKKLESGNDGKKSPFKIDGLKKFLEAIDLNINKADNETYPFIKTLKNIERGIGNLDNKDVIKALESLKLEAPKEININNLKEIKSDNSNVVEVLTKILNKEAKEPKDNIKEVVKAIKAIKIETPKIDIPAPIVNNDTSKLERLVTDLIIAVKKQKPSKETDNKDIIKAIKGIKVDTPIIEFPSEINTHVLTEPVRKIPQPVTHINVNSLNGFVETTATTVGTTLTTLPGYGVLNNRRALILYNNGANTIYVGGSDVTVSNGLPVPKNTYSPPLSVGKKTIFYGVTSSGSSDVRVLEISDEDSGR